MRKKMISAVLLALAVAACGGCDFTVPLTTAPALPMDQSLAGLWQSAQAGGPADELLVLPLGPLEMLVAYPAGKKDAMFARACLWRGAELTLVQLQWLGTARGVLPQDPRVFQFASCQLEDGCLRVRLLNAEILPKDAQTAGELTRAIAKLRDDKNLFRPALEFRRIKN